MKNSKSSKGFAVRKLFKAIFFIVWILVCSWIIAEQPLRIAAALVTSRQVYSSQVSASTVSLSRAFHMHFLKYGVYVPTWYFRTLPTNKASLENSVAFLGKKVKLEVWLPLQVRLPVLGTYTRIVNWNI
jgi:hypothetical protein